MPDEVHGDPEDVDTPVAGDDQPPADAAARADSGQVVLRRQAEEPTAVLWRRRAVAVRTSLPQLVRHPVVVGASAAAAGIAARVAVELAVRAVGARTSASPVAVNLTGRVLHELHVVHHVHHVHHVVHHHPRLPGGPGPGA